MKKKVKKMKRKKRFLAAVAIAFVILSVCQVAFAYENVGPVDGINSHRMYNTGSLEDSSG